MVQNGESQVKASLGEQLLADLDDAKSYQVQIHIFLQEGEYNEEQVYNCDKN